MPTPSALVVPPYAWTAVVAASLVLLGVAVSRLSGRLVHLFGPANPHRNPDPHSTLRVHGEPPSPLRGDDAMAVPATAEGAPGETPTPGGDDEGPAPPRCPHCRAEIPFLRGLPVVGARRFRRHGACPHCERVIRPHPAVVVTTSLLFGLVGAMASLQSAWSPFGLLAVLWLVAVGVPLSVIDLRVMRLPDAMVAPAYPVAAGLVGLSVLLPPSGPDPDRALGALVSMVLVTVLYWLLWRFHSEGLGFGDVKLSGLTALYAGWAAGPFGALVAVFWAFAAFSLVGVVLIVLRRATRRDPFPLGPFMLAAALATVLAGGALVP